jgi:hypothetical protein
MEWQHLEDQKKLETEVMTTWRQIYVSTRERGMTLDEQGFHLFTSNWRKANVDLVGQRHK